MKDARLAARALQRHAKGYAAGAFATPTAQELERTDWRWINEAAGSLIVCRVLSRESRRRAWTGEAFVLPAGCRIVTHAILVGPQDGHAVAPFDFVRVYAEDRVGNAILRGQDRQPYATTISAASEIHHWYGPPGAGASRPVAPVDAVSVARLALPAGVAPDWARMRAEIATLSGWADDFPYYSDGSWSAISLRGFDPGNPAWGVKPSEMGRKWNEAHPGALAMSCDWTAAADLCPEMLRLVNALPWVTGLERVRLMRIRGRAGRPHVLRRHSDITDRTCGTRDGAVARFMVPLITHPAVVTTVWDLSGGRNDVHLEADSIWYLDARKPHAVSNPSGLDRVQLAIDVVMGPESRAAILEGQRAA